MKTCSDCKQERPVEEFHRWRASYQPYCKVCKKVRDANRYQAQRPLRQVQIKANRYRVVGTLRSLKEGRPCVDCGGVFHFAAMQFDHLPGFEKVSNLSALASHGTGKKLEAELKKCVLVCANCHAVRTYERAHPA